MEALLPARIVADTRWIGPHGIGRFAREVLSRIPGVSSLPEGLRLFHPLDPFWLRRQLKRLNPALYFSPGFNPPWRSPVPFVFTLYDLIHLRFPPESGLLRRAYYSRIVRPAARSAARILTVSRHSRDEILEWTHLEDRSVVVVWSGTGPPFASEGPRYAGDLPYILYVGNRKPHKNLPRLFKAFARSGLAMDFSLVLSGNPDFRHTRLAAGLGLAGRVRFSGSMGTDEDLAALYRGATLLAIPSLYEGFGLPALEAMACGTPVVSSRACSLPEVVGEAAEYVDAKDPESIAQGLRRVVESSSLVQDLRRRGLERAREFTWERTARLTWEALREAVGLPTR